MPQNKTQTKPRILLVEDNAGDEFLILDAFQHASYPYEIEVARDGEEALNRIQRTNGFADAPLPDLILLDLNLPKVDGRSVLKTVKTDEGLMQLPVLILTTSSSERDIEECYELHANAYMTKPFKVEDYENIVESIGSFWFRAVKLPAH